MKAIQVQIGKIIPDPTVELMGRDYKVAIQCYTFLNS